MITVFYDILCPKSKSREQVIERKEQFLPKVVKKLSLINIDTVKKSKINTTFAANY